jgi:uncharacterized glyoxalase superfamily protein PhnB
MDQIRVGLVAMSEEWREAESRSEQTVVPMVAYADGVAAMDWLVRVFGFRERARLLDNAGRLAHGELVAGDGLIMLATPTPDYEGPRQHREHCERARRWSDVPWVIDGVLVRVDDVTAHFGSAQREGARILSPLEAGPPAARYRAEDLEGHRWMFMERTPR